MFHIKEKVISNIEVKKSKFICLLLPLDDDNLIKQKIAEIKKEYPNATHYCYGSVIGDLCRSNDDGEPASTAGKPILEVLRNKQLDNVLAVVVRYFGGTLLGTAGLVKAYGQVTSEAVNKAQLTVPTEVGVYKLVVDYALTSKVEYALKNNNAEIIEREYLEKAVYNFICRDDLSLELKELTSGKCEIELIEKRILEI